MVFAAFVLLHTGAWIGADRYLSASPRQVLVVADTSYSMKTQFPKMQAWLKQQQDGSRYQALLVGTDKAMLGEFRKLKSATVIFRTAFGRMSLGALKKYDAVDASEKILLSDGSVNPDGWSVVVFD